MTRNLIAFLAWDKSILRPISDQMWNRTSLYDSLLFDKWTRSTLFFFFFFFSFSIEPKNRVEKNFVIRPIRTFQINEEERCSIDRYFFAFVLKILAWHTYTHIHTHRSNISIRSFIPRFTLARILNTSNLSAVWLRFHAVTDIGVWHARWTE